MIRVFSSMPLQTVQRAELWRVILSLHAFVRVFAGIDNLNVFNFFSKQLDGFEWFKRCHCIRRWI